jgi:uncharacterized membrane protein (Fun14 family)
MSGIYYVGIGRGLCVGLGIGYAFRNENKLKLIGETILAIVVPLPYIGYNAYVNRDSIRDFVHKKD